MPTLCVNPRCPRPANPDQGQRCAACGWSLELGADSDGRGYRCRQLLGQGGFGRTYLSTDEAAAPPRRCVVKQLLPPGTAGDRPRPDRFRAEADRLATLGQHPQIPALLAAIDSAQGQFLVQDYIPGPSLDQVPPPAAEAEALVRRVLYELLPVLSYIHDRGVIHRDIKPANILVPPAPQPLVLVDFGAAKAVVDSAQLQRTGTVIGSAGYAAPEQALGKAVFASDIFSLGVTCLHLLTGQHPFDLYSVAEDAWVWRSYLVAPVSPSLGRVLDRMVNRRLAERYSSAQAVLADLRWSGLGETQAAKRSLPVERRAAAALAWEQRFALSLPGLVANGLAISPSGRAIATACSDGSVRLWDCTDGTALRTFRKSLGLLGRGHRGPVNAVAFTPQGEAVISGGEDGQVLRWPLAEGRGEGLPLAGWPIATLLVTADGTLAAGSGDGRIYLWPLAGHAAPTPLIHHQDQVNALAVDGAGTLLVSGGRDRTLRLWSLPSGRLTRTLTAPQAAITAVACHPTDGRIVSGDAEGQVQVWSPERPETGLVIQKLTCPVTALAISADGAWLAIGAEDGGLSGVHLGGGGQTHQRHGWAVRALSFAPDSRLLVSSGADETIRFWSVPPAIA